MIWKLPLFKTHVTDTDVQAVKEVIERGTYWAAGPEVQAFEDALAKYMGTKHVIVFNSGTSALHALLLAYDVKGKEVIVPSFTFVSTATSVIMAGGTPVFAETEEKTLGLDTEDVKNKITENTKAVIALHYGGTPAREILQLKELCEEKKLILIEDNAESMGAEIKGKKAGTFGHAGMLSFCQSKIITTGEGGAITTDDRRVYEKLKLIRSHGREEGKEDYFTSTGDNDYITIGYNWRMPTMNAALGLSQLNHIEELISLRREKAARYKESLKDIKEITFPEERENKAVHQLFTIMLPDKTTRDGLQRHLTEAGVMSKVYFPPAHLKTLYKKRYGYKRGDLPRTEAISDRVLSLPFYPDIGEQGMKTVTEIIKSYFQEE
ncbi:DegT/DnrJ/EryC1/StrS family aminotransferase [Candidatus Woesearchaeota archaeon]|nr:DegT/DnrJ/EryC1/StrS family aminotransferase [Candidatus Woesearchaeota archaeon]